MRDPGLQPERTSLAWWRTGLAVSIGVATILRYALPTSAVGCAATGLVIVATITVLYAAKLRAHALREEQPPRAVTPRAVAFLTWAVALAGMGVLTLSLTQK